MGAAAGAAAIAGGISAAGGIASSMIGGSKAAGAAKDAANLQEQMFLMNQGNLGPFRGAGESVLDPLTQLARSGPTGGGPDYIAQAAGERPGQMTQAQLEATPGYQFTLSQGLKSVQSAAAARGLGVSGASLKGAADYATGLADKTYIDQFNLQQQRFQDLINLNTGQQTNLQNQYQRLYNTAALGENAAAQTGTMGTTAAANAGNYLNQAGLASAAGTQGAANAITGAAQNYLGYNLLQQALHPAATTGGYAPITPADTAGWNPNPGGY